jgi:putative endonuclease
MRFRHASERRAVLHYLLRGYRILGTNVWAGGNELDVIARRGRRIVFCEVKSKSGPRYGEPLAMVGPEKVRRVRHAARAWLAARPELHDLEVRFDVVTESNGRLRRVSKAF